MYVGKVEQDRLEEVNPKHMIDKINNGLALAKRAFVMEMDDRAQMGGGTNLVGLFMGLLIAAIVAVSVFIPVVNDAIAQQTDLSGNVQTILELLPLFAALLLLIALAAPLMRRV